MIKPILFITTALASITVWAQNPKPKVIPALMEWTGGEGSFVLSPSSRICFDPVYASDLIEGANALKQDLFDETGLDFKIDTTKAANTGDLILTLGCTDSGIGNEGYLIEISNAVTIKANSSKGAFWGTRTFLQMIRQDPLRVRIAQGKIRDYPKWPIRDFLLDVGRMPIPMNYLKEYVKFMSYYKMNDLQLHLTDNTGFRLKGDYFPGLASTDVFYTKKEYSDFQKFARSYGVQVVSEIESPAHAGFITKYRPNLQHTGLGEGHLDISRPETIQFMDSLWDDLAPAMEVVHIGTDEYTGGVAKDLITYINHTNDYLHAKGKGTVRMWGSQATYGGAADVGKDILVNIWDEKWYNPLTAIKDGYDIVNTNQTWYIVPTAPGGYADFLDVEKVYAKSNVYDFDAGSSVSPDHPQLKGAQWCLWNDLWGSAHYSIQDVHARDRGPMKAFSQKMWRQDTELPFPEFSTLMGVLGDGPGTAELMDPPKQGNLVYGAAVSSSDLSYLFAAEKIVDNSEKTRWAAKEADSEWIYVYVDKLATVNKVVLNWETAYAREYMIQVSNDALNWTTAYSEKAGSGGTDTITFANIVANYVKMQGVKRGTTFGYSLYEFEVYGIPLTSINPHERRGFPLRSRVFKIFGENVELPVEYAGVRSVAYVHDIIGKLLKRLTVEGRSFNLHVAPMEPSQVYLLRIEPAP